LAANAAGAKGAKLLILGPLSRQAHYEGHIQAIQYLVDVKK
jgi:hypothetical protein